MKIIKFEDKYRDDMIYMVLSAKNALGRVPRLNEDLLDIKTNYFDKGHPFWIALDEYDRVIGCIGTKVRVAWVECYFIRCAAAIADANPAFIRLLENTVGSKSCC